MAKQGRTPTGPGAESSALDSQAEAQAAVDEVTSTGDVILQPSFLADAERRIAKLQDMLADVYARAFCCEIMNGHRSQMAPTVVKFSNGTSQGTYDSVRDMALQLLRGED